MAVRINDTIITYYHIYETRNAVLVAARQLIHKLVSHESRGSGFSLSWRPGTARIVVGHTHWLEPTTRSEREFISKHYLPFSCLTQTIKYTQLLTGIIQLSQNLSTVRQYFYVTGSILALWYPLFLVHYKLKKRFSKYLEKTYKLDTNLGSTSSLKWGPSINLVGHA